jgi:multidrug efflux system membrane fusion protein
MDQQNQTTPVPPDHRLPAHAAADAPPPKKRPWIWIVVLVLIVLVFYWGLKRHDKNAKTAGGPGGRGRFFGPVTLTTATAKQGSIGVYVSALGTVTALHTVSISSQVTGVIDAVYYREGQYVRKGQPLVDIDPRPYQAQVMQAQGTLKRDQNLLAEAKMDLARYQIAWSHNAIPRQTLEDQQKLVLQDEGTVENDQGVLKYDQVQLGYCHIVAPMDGKVGLRLVDPGNLVTANSGTSLVVVTSMNPITVISPISESALTQVLAQPGHGLGLPIEVWDSNKTHMITRGKVTAINNQIDTTTGTVLLRATFNNSKDELYPNQFVNTRLLVKTLKNQTLVPDSAVQHNGNESYVFLIQHGPHGLTAKMQDVTTGVSDEGIVAVQGVQPGDVIANSSFEKLQNGSPVKISKVALSSSTSESNIP